MNAVCAFLENSSKELGVSLQVKPALLKFPFCQTSSNFTNEFLFDYTELLPCYLIKDEYFFLEIFKCNWKMSCQNPQMLLWKQISLNSG